MFFLLKAMLMCSILVRTTIGIWTDAQSDYGATHSTVPSALAGMDMELPSAHYC